MSAIPCLSVRQPYAWAIVAGHKPLENRTWFTGLRGRILIHAGQTWGREEVRQLEALREEFPKIDWPSTYELGGIVGETRLTACLRPEQEGRIPEDARPWYREGAHAFLLADSRPVQFVRYKGAQGFFGVEESMLTPCCRRHGCGDLPLVLLREGEQRQTGNGFLIAKVEGLYCPNCAGSYGVPRAQFVADDRGD